MGKRCKTSIRFTEEEYKLLIEAKNKHPLHTISEDENGKPKIRTKQRKMNNTEQRMYNQLIAEKRAGVINDVSFEGITFKLADDTRYTPDFVVKTNEGSLRLLETKGGHIWEDGLLKFKIAMDKYPMFKWEMWQWDSKQYKFILLRGN